MAGFDGQLGFKSETTVGTGVTVDTFHEGFLNASVRDNIARIDSQGIRAGRRTKAKWKAGASAVGGNVNLELWNHPLATLLTHMFGTVATSGAGPYTHTATPGVLTGKSLTVQVGKPLTGSSTVEPFTYAGTKIAGWEISCGVGEIPTLSLELSAWSLTTATALASATYIADGEPFVFTEGSLSIAGSAVATVRQVSLSGSNTLATDRHRFGSATVKEQLENGLREYSGTVETDFESLTAYNRYVNGTEAALVLAFDNGTDSLTITANVRFDGETPEISGPEILGINLPFMCLSATTDAAAITCVLVNGETSAA